MDISDFQPEQISRKKNIGKEIIPGEGKFEANFSEQVVTKIAEHNFRKQEPTAITYLKPTKAALYGLHLRFQSLERHQKEERAMRKIGRRTNEQDSVYHINSQMLGKKKDNGSKSLIMTSNKKTLENQIKKNGKETIVSRHTNPLDIQNLLKEQRQYSYQPPEEVSHKGRQASEMVKVPRKIQFPDIKAKQEIMSLIDDVEMKNFMHKSMLMTQDGNKRKTENLGHLLNDLTDSKEAQQAIGRFRKQQSLIVKNGQSTGFGKLPSMQGKDIASIYQSQDVQSVASMLVKPEPIQKVYSSQSKRFLDILDTTNPSDKAYSTQSGRRDISDLNFVDFMPREEMTGKPVHPKKPGNLHFHVNLGSCFDSLIAEQVNSYVPKHKSFLKESDIKYVPKKTKQELDEENEKEKAKSAIDHMFEQVVREKQRVERDDQRVKVKVDCRRKKKQPDANYTEQSIKAASIFQTSVQEEAVKELMENAETSERMQQIAERSIKALRAVHEKSTDLMKMFGDQNPMNWIELDEGLKNSQTWTNVSTDDLKEKEFKVYKQKSIKALLKLHKKTSSTRDESHSMHKNLRSSNVSPSPERSQSPDNPLDAYDSVQSTKNVNVRHSQHLAGPKSLFRGNSAIHSEVGGVRKSQKLPRSRHRHAVSVAPKDEQNQQNWDSSKQQQAGISMNQLAPYHSNKELVMNDSWTIGPLSKFSHNEKKVIKDAMKEELNRYQKQALARYDDQKNTSLMVDQSDHQIRNEVMRRNFLQQLKHKHIHDFKRKVVDEIHDNRKHLPGYSPNRKESLNQSSVEQSTADVSPTSRKISIQEMEVRQNFGKFVTDMVSKNGGDAGGKRDNSFEAMVKRAESAVTGAKNYKSQFGGPGFETAVEKTKPK